MCQHIACYYKVKQLINVLKLSIKVIDMLVLYTSGILYSYKTQSIKQPKIKVYRNIPIYNINRYFYDILNYNCYINDGIILFIAHQISLK